MNYKKLKLLSPFTLQIVRLLCNIRLCSLTKFPCSQALCHRSSPHKSRQYMKSNDPIKQAAKRRTNVSRSRKRCSKLCTPALSLC